MQKSINWMRLASELKSTPGSATLLRALQGHGITHLVTFADPPGTGISQSNSIEKLLDDVSRA